MAEFLSESWIAELDRAARDAASLVRLGSPEPLVVEQRVQHGDDEVVYHVSLAASGARVQVGPAAAPDLVLVTDAETARRLQQGTLNAQQAAKSRRLKVRGQVGRLRSAAEALRSLDDVFQTVRDATTYPAESGRRRTPPRASPDDRRGGVSQEDDTVISEAEFRAEAKAFLDAHAEPRVEEKFEWGKGSDRVGLLEEKTAEQEAEEIRAAKAWKATEYDAGFGWITGPEEYGGRALPAAYERAYREVAARYAIQSQSIFGIGLGMVAPTILAHAIPDVKRRYLAPLHRGDIIACQLFSEPVAGSDLAGIQTRAERDGDEWILNGQKVWTSGAQYSDIGEIITRTSTDKPKHKGLTMFLGDMKAPGVEVRPLRQMTGGASFNEVFFADVRVLDTHRLGDVDEGWTVALTTLMNERASIGGGGAAGFSLSLTRLRELALHYARDEDPIVRQRLADIYIRMTVARYTNLRAMEKIRAGQLPGPEMSIAKLALTQNMQRVAQTLGELLGPRLVADSGEWGTFAWSEFVLGIPGMRVAGGTDEVMRNIVGERVLGLPKEPPGQAGR